MIQLLYHNQLTLSQDLLPGPDCLYTTNCTSTHPQKVNDWSQMGTALLYGFHSNQNKLLDKEGATERFNTSDLLFPFH